jgi:hypothetical protein
LNGKDSVIFGLIVFTGRPWSVSVLSLLGYCKSQWLFGFLTEMFCSMPPSYCPHPANHADIGIVFKLVLQARQHKAMRLYRIGIRATYR